MAGAAPRRLVEAELASRGVMQRLQAAQGVLAGPILQDKLQAQFQGREMVRRLQLKQLRQAIMDGLRSQGLDLSGVDVAVKFVGKLGKRGAAPAEEGRPAPWTDGKLSIQVQPTQEAWDSAAASVKRRLSNAG